MDKRDAAKLLTLIQLSYPASYRNMDDDWKLATINMWESSFRDVPYSIMEQGFNRYRMTHKFPPTVAEMVEELRHIYFQTLELENVYRTIENGEAVQRCRMIIAATERYRDERSLNGLVESNLLRMGGVANVGTSGDRLDRADRLPQLGAAQGG